jgi:hypothetical protein
MVFANIELCKWDDEPIELIVLTAEELNLPEWEFETEIGDGMPIAFNGFPPSEWL